MTEQQELIPLAAGEYLKQQRTTRKLSLAVVANAIKLDETLLRKIEDDEADHIAPVYRNGYIQLYANYLQIPQAEIQQLTDRTMQEETALRTVFSEPPRRNAVDNWLRASSYVLASLLIGTLAWQFTHEAVRLSQNGPALAGPVNASIASLTALHDGPAKRSDSARQTEVPLSTASLPEGESRLLVSVSADSWVEINDADGRELEMDLLRGGSQKSYQGKTPFRILIGRASAVRLSMNGRAVDMTPFISDDVVQMTWPPQQPAEKPGVGVERAADN